LGRSGLDAEVDIDAEIDTAAAGREAL